MNLGTILFIVGVILVAFSVYAVVAVASCRRRAGLQRVAVIGTSGLLCLVVGIGMYWASRDNRYTVLLDPAQKKGLAGTLQDREVHSLNAEEAKELEEWRNVPRLTKEELDAMADDSLRQLDEWLIAKLPEHAEKLRGKLSSPPITSEPAAVPVPKPPVIETHPQKTVSVAPDGKGGVTVMFLGASGIIETGVVIQQHETIEVLTPNEVKGLIVGDKLMPGARCFRNPPTPPGGMRWSPVPARDFQRPSPYTLLTAQKGMIVLNTSRVSDPGPHIVHISRVPYKIPLGMDAQGKPLRKLYMSQ